MRKRITGIAIILLVLFAIGGVVCACLYKNDLEKIRARDGLMLEVITDTFAPHSSDEYGEYAKRDVRVYYDGCVSYEYVSADGVLEEGEFYLSDADLVTLYRRTNRVVEQEGFGIEPREYFDNRYHMWDSSLNGVFNFYDGEGNKYQLYKGNIEKDVGAESFYLAFFDLIDEAERVIICSAEESNEELLEERDPNFVPEQINCSHIEDGIYEGRILRISGNGDAVIVDLHPVVENDESFCVIDIESEYQTYTLQILSTTEIETIRRMYTSGIYVPSHTPDADELIESILVEIDGTQNAPSDENDVYAGDTNLFVTEWFIENEGTYNPDEEMFGWYVVDGYVGIIIENGEVYRIELSDERFESVYDSRWR